MENTVLVGLSRQIALRRELDVIANNLANLGTTGFKSESVLFEEHLANSARSDNFSVPQDRHGPRHEPHEPPGHARRQRV
jgi:flagellar basal body rod protein FlgG